MVTQDRVALVFAERAEGAFKYCHSTGAWFRWTGQYWAKDECAAAFQYARNLARSFTSSLTNGELKEIGKVSFAAGVERFAQSDPRLAVSAEWWDNDPFLLGTPGGTVNLRTGELRPSQPSEGVSRVTAVAPDLKADCPRWLAFLDEATGGDREVARFLQQWGGYCLTGVTREHALVFVYGPGGNGKSVWLNTITAVLNGYATTAAMDTFTASAGDKHPTDLAMLRGARLVTASETEEGR
ncbi:MAG: phage/plasmid primase, P4 family, partial [Dietzia sp.]|nr:phage/plasmid primase, P4 family [Dietzia sp.]